MLQRLGKTSLAITPISVIDGRAGPWLARKRLWAALGLRGEVGRHEAGKGGAFESHAHFNSPAYGKTGVEKTSTFDPVLCEVLYRWYAPPGSRILDPFAGGPTRGVVAATLGYNYTGVDLSDRQVWENTQQAQALGVTPRWLVGDSRRIFALLRDDKPYDMAFTCPPYYNLEVYTDNPQDLSLAKTYGDFLGGYEAALTGTVFCLRPNSFFVLVTGLVPAHGGYYNLPSDTARIMQRLGLKYWAEAIYITPVNTAAITSSYVFGQTKRLVRTHQYIQVFYYGDEDKVMEKFPEKERSDGNGDVQAPQLSLLQDSVVGWGDDGVEGHPEGIQDNR